MDIKSFIVRITTLFSRKYSLFQDSVFFVRQFYGKASRFISPKPHPAGDLRLHLGCGAINCPGFVNVDGIDYPYVHYVQSLTHLTRFRDASVAFIYSSHTLEHFPRAQTVSILQEWYRVLVPGGKLCVSVPDFDCILDIYHLERNVNENGAWQVPYKCQYRRPTSSRINGSYD